MRWSGNPGRLARAAIAGTLASLAVVASVQASTPLTSSSSGPVSQAATKDIVDTAVGAGSFNTLVQAVQAAGLVETLKGPGPFTVFAPTDAAFAKLPQGTLESLLADPAKLRDVLTYHVVSGKVQAADVVKLTSAKTVQGGNVSIAVTGSTVRLNGTSTVTQTDIQATNGVIHVIDTVLLPPAAAATPTPTPAPAQAAAKDIVDTAVGAGSFKTLVQAVQAAGLVETLKGPGPFTVFAPTDAAFAKLPQGTVEALLANPAQLREVLTYHVVSGKVQAADVVKLTSAKTVQGGNVSIAVSGSTVRLNGNSTVTQTDIQATNGVIHVIDTVLLPPGMAATPAAPKSGTGGYLGSDSSNGGAWLAVVLAAATLGGLGTAQLARSRNR
jgi:transforming growth factor-beta-induced protein